MKDVDDKSKKPAVESFAGDARTRFMRPGKSIRTAASVLETKSTEAGHPQQAKTPPPIKASTLKPAQAEIQLTRIRQAIRDQDSSRGFAQAKQAADKALASNKIILNNRFVLEATLGAGGMGTVYRAKDLRKVEARDPNPYVAVKVLNDSFKNHPDAFVTLQREASRSHILSHPNIVTVHDFDRDGDVIYMTMELLQGQALDAILRRHRGQGLPKPQALKIIREIGWALAHAHQKHIVHSDLKPGNIFITQDGAKVLDFGIARLTNAATEDFDAGVLGALTMTYASLEMIEGEDPHPADDVYAAAIIAYEMFSGNHPYQRKSATDALAENLKPAPLKNLNKIQWQTLAKGLKLKREDRLQTIAEFYKGLTVPRRPVKTLLLAVVVSSLLIGTAGYRFFAGNPLSSRIDETFAQAQQCLRDQNYTCALDAAKAVLQLAPQHQGAPAILAQAQAAIETQYVAKLSDEFQFCLQQHDPSCARNILNTISSVKAGADSVTLLQNELNQYLQQQTWAEQLQQARDCLTRQEFDCAVEKVQAVLSQDHSTEAAQLLEQINSAQQKFQSDLSARESRYQQAVQKTESCLSRREFSCAREQAKRAVNAQIDSVAAQALAQKVAFAEQEYQGNLQKAKNVLAKGRSCLANKNFSCAIANSDSALEFVPGYQPALQLGQEARTALEKLKSQIIIE